MNQAGTPPPADNRESLLKNGGFEEGPEFWTGTQCEVIPEPGRQENSVMEVSLSGDGFQLEQAFQGPAEKRDLTLSFRVRSAETIKRAPAGVSLDMLDAKGTTFYSTFLTVKVSEKWTTFTGTLGLSIADQLPATIRFKCRSDEGKLWVDEVTLK